MAKTISRVEIVKIVKNEYQQAKDFCSHDFGRYYRMMIDLDDGSIWSDVFLDHNQWKNYHSSSICQLERSELSLAEIKLKRFPVIVNAYVNHAVELLSDAGWKITD